MSEQDPLDMILREDQPPEFGAELDERIIRSYRAHFAAGMATARTRWWNLRLSIPIPVLLAALGLFVALLIWFRSSPTPNSRTLGPGVVTQINEGGFQPLPDGQARVVEVRESIK